MAQIELAIFDLAGTTIADEGHVLSAFRTALLAQSIQLTHEMLQPWRGAAKREALRFFIEQKFGQNAVDNAARLAQAESDFREQLAKNFEEEGVPPIAGAEATFAWLRDHGIKIAVTTGFDRKLTNIILAKTGWQNGVIDASVCSDEVAQGRPAPYMIFHAMEATGVTDVRRVLTAGDTMLDLQSGINAGVAVVIGVLSGAQSVEQLGKTRHTHLLASVADLPALLANEL